MAKRKIGKKLAKIAPVIEKAAQPLRKPFGPLNLYTFTHERKPSEKRLVGFSTLGCVWYVSACAQRADFLRRGRIIAFIW
jgi:hypothetical protein